MMNTTYIDKDKLIQYTELISKHMDVIHENGAWQFSEALKKCFGNIHYCVDNARHMEEKIYN